MFRLLVAVVIAVVAAATTAAETTALLSLAQRQHYAEPAETKLTQYQLLRQMQQLNALYDQTETAARQAELADTLSHIAANYSRLGQSVLAAFYYDQAWRIEPNAAERQYDLAVELISIGELITGEQMLRQSLAGSATDYHRQRLLANGFIQLGKWSEAASLLRTVLAKSKVPTDQFYAYQMLTGLQSLLPESERKQPAAPTVREPASWPAVMSRDLLHADESALSDYLQTVQQRDLDAFREQLCEALFYRGLYWQGIGASDTAKAYFQAALDMNLPGFFESQLARFFLYRMQPASNSTRASSWDPNPIS